MYCGLGDSVVWFSLEFGNQTMSSIVSAMDTAMQQVRILSERKDLFPRFQGCWEESALGCQPSLMIAGTSRKLSLQITCPFRAALQPMTNKCGAYRLSLPSFGWLWRAIRLQDNFARPTDALVGPAYLLDFPILLSTFLSSGVDPECTP